MLSTDQLEDRRLISGNSLSSINGEQLGVVQIRMKFLSAVSTSETLRAAVWDDGLRERANGPVSTTDNPNDPVSTACLSARVPLESMHTCSSGFLPVNSLAPCTALRYTLYKIVNFGCTKIVQYLYK